MSDNKVVMLYNCICLQAFRKKTQLRQHVSVCNYAQNQGNQCANRPGEKDLLQVVVSKCEMECINDDLSTCNEQAIERFKCGCEKRFKSKGGYYRHIKKCKFRPEHQVVSGKTKCNEPGCLLTFKYIRDFRQHLNEKHEIKFDVEDKKFVGYSDFLRWKENYETETRSCFYHRKTETRSGRKVEYWYCNRSGIYQSVSQGRRRKLKSQGILKINNNCTSSITLTIDEIEGNVKAIVHHTHYGHEAELVHLRIPKSDKQEIASKLLQGVKIEDILLSYKEDSSSKQNIERKHLIKRRDILNISKKYNVNIILPQVKQPSKTKKNYEIVQGAIEPLHNNESLPNTTETKKRHLVASQLPLSLVNPIYENVWRVSMGNNLIPTYSSDNYNEAIYHVTKNDVTNCINDCKAYCLACNICYHSYTCSCTDFLSNKIICEHVHLVELFQVTSHTYQFEDNVERTDNNNQDHTNYTQHFTESISSTEPIDSVCLSDDISENNDLLSIKPNVKMESLKRRVEKLILETLQKVNECNNYDLLENIERDMTNITCNLGIDLQQNKKRSNDTPTIIAPEKNIEVYYVF